MKTKYVYPAILTPEEKNYSVEFPDLKGCQTFGSSLEEALEMANDVLGLYIVTLLEESIDIPEASKESHIKRKKGQEVTYINVDISKYLKGAERVKKTLTIPKWLDEQAKKESINFSKALEDSLVRELSAEYDVD